MDPRYREWIAKNAPENPLGLCREMCERMLAEFHELKLVRGHYIDAFWGERGHWWLAAKDGSIVDPTVAQFPDQGMGEYIEWNEGDPEPTGKCPNCGGLCYDGNTFCSEDCGKECMAYLDRERKR